MIKTARSDIALSPWSPKDESALAALANNILIYRNTCFIPHPYTKEEARRFLSLVSPKLDFCIRYKNKAAGACGITLQDNLRRHSAEIGFWLGEEFWNQGILSAVLPALTEYAFSKLHLRRIYGIVFEQNKASARVFLKSGFIQAGFMTDYLSKDGALMSCFLFEKIRPT